MSHTIKVTVTDEFLSLLDERIKQEHAAGRSEYIRQALREKLLQSKQNRPLYESASKEEWSKVFRDWAYSHNPNTPILSDEAMSRENIYSRRGL